MACERSVALAGTALGDIATKHPIMTADDVISVLLRVYRQGDPTTRSRCIDVIDQLSESRAFRSRPKAKRSALTLAATWRAPDGARHNTRKSTLPVRRYKHPLGGMPSMQGCRKVPIGRGPGLWRRRQNRPPGWRSRMPPAQAAEQAARAEHAERQADAYRGELAQLRAGTSPDADTTSSRTPRRTGQATQP
jgi:hypothetical protein